MERRTCKLCFKSFSNGRALGGHMRSHMTAIQPPTPPEHQLTAGPPPRHTQQSSSNNKNKHGSADAIESASSSSTSSSSEEEESQAAMLSYGLRENPKKSFRFADPEFSFAVDAGSVVVQDRESETESSKNPSRRRSKRVRKSNGVGTLFLHLQPHHRLHQQEQDQQKQTKKCNYKGNSIVEAEPVSSVSDTIPEEDVARCLMMLSRGVWARRTERSIDETDKVEDVDEDNDVDVDVDEDEDEDAGDGEEMELGRMNRSKASKYQCGTCKKVFKSYQALGGHRASHKKIRGCNPNPNPNPNNHNNLCSSSSVVVVAEVEKNQNLGNADASEQDRRVHKCPICFRVFGSGQALGGHKRSHLTGSASASTTTISLIHNHMPNSIKFADNLIDLNLPAPIEEDDASQVELSAVSDAEFVCLIK